MVRLITREGRMTKKLRYWRVTHKPKGLSFIEGMGVARVTAPTKEQAEKLVRDRFKDEIEGSHEITDKKEISRLFSILKKRHKLKRVM